MKSVTREAIICIIAVVSNQRYEITKAINPVRKPNGIPINKREIIIKKIIRVPIPIPNALIMIIPPDILYRCDGIYVVLKEQQ